MGLSIVKFQSGKQEKWGILAGETIKPFKNNPQSLSELLAAPAVFTQADNLDAATLSIQKVNLLAPVSSPLRVVCQGLNYASHRAESALSAHSKTNVLFGKDESSITGAFSPIMRPKDCQCLDYEVELGMIIKKNIVEPIQVNAANLHEYVAGLVLANDMSPRDLQYRDDFAQWYKAKSCRTMLPLGPVLYLMEKEDFKHLHNLNLQLWVNDELRQNANTAQLIFKPAETLTEISTFMNLSAGDLLLTGTPGGVVVKAPNRFVQGMATWLLSNEKKTALFRKQHHNYLQDGDRVKARIVAPDGSIDLGTQLNTIVPYGF